MSKLYLIRHAQASFFAEDYDKLSPLGEEQSQRLGEYLAQQNISFDAVYTGPALRHHQTADIVRNVFEKQNLSLPSSSVIPELDEHATDKMIKQSLPHLVETHPEISQLANQYQSAPNPADQKFAFYSLFQAVVNLWVNDEISDDEIESWGHFSHRVETGLKQILNEQQSDKTVLVFSSAGPISLILQQAVKTQTQETLQFGWRLRNSAINRFVYTGDQFTLDAYNSYPHLTDSKMVTYL